MAIELTPNPTTDEADGYYPDRQSVIDGMGADNFAILSNLGADSDSPNEANVRKAFDKADAYIDGRAIVLGVTAAGTAGHYVGASATIWGPLQLWASELAGVYIFRLRGVNVSNQQPTDDPAEGQFAAKYREAVKRIDELLASVAGTQLGAIGQGGLEVIKARPCRPRCGYGPYLNW